MENREYVPSFAFDDSESRAKGLENESVEVEEIALDLNLSSPEVRKEKIRQYKESGWRFLEADLAAGRFIHKGTILIVRPESRLTLDTTPIVEGPPDDSPTGFVVKLIGYEKEANLRDFLVAIKLPQQ